MEHDMTVHMGTRWLNVLNDNDTEREYCCQACSKAYMRRELFDYEDIQACQECVSDGRAYYFARQMK